MIELEPMSTEREKLILQGKLPGHFRFKKKSDIPRLGQEYGDDLRRSSEELLEILQKEWEENN